MDTVLLTKDKRFLRKAIVYTFTVLSFLVVHVWVHGLFILLMFMVHILHLFRLQLHIY